MEYQIPMWGFGFSGKRNKSLLKLRGKEPNRARGMQRGIVVTQKKKKSKRLFLSRAFGRRVKKHGINNVSKKNSGKMEPLQPEAGVNDLSESPAAGGSCRWGGKGGTKGRERNRKGGGKKERDRQNSTEQARWDENKGLGKIHIARKETKGVTKVFDRPKKRNRD